MRRVVGCLVVAVVAGGATTSLYMKCFVDDVWLLAMSRKEDLGDTAAAKLDLIQYN